MNSAAARPAPLLLADHMALDFLNTVATPSTAALEWLADGEDLLEWLKRVGAIDEAVAARWAILFATATSSWSARARAWDAR
jgi:Putative stress-induced transcription regulator